MFKSFRITLHTTKNKGTTLFFEELTSRSPFIVYTQGQGQEEHFGKMGSIDIELIPYLNPCVFASLTLLDVSLADLGTEEGMP